MNNDKRPVGLMVAPVTLASNSITLVWDKPDQYLDIIVYHVYQNDEKIATTEKNRTHITVKGLKPETTYKFRAEAVTEELDVFSTEILVVQTKLDGKKYDVTKAPYYADETGHKISTVSVQNAIDECHEGGTVLIPKGSVVLTGALELKSNMTLQIDGVLKGSLEPEDYVIHNDFRKSYQGLANEDGLILTRYEGWEMYCYRSLINAGHLNPLNRKEVTCENIRICGEGTIYGGGNKLGTAMKKLYADKEKYPVYVSDGIGGRRTRGRLLGLIQCKNVHITGVNIENPPCWTVHMIYCDTVTTHGVSIKSRGIDNGDGWDPDSSQNLMIFDTTFDTGDDCIAIKSGKNPDGNLVDIPTKNVRIFGINMLGGHGMTIGSEQSGGVEGVTIRDCKIKNTLYGLELKAHNSRGGYIKDVKLMDCEIDRFMAHSVNYNADGIPAPDLPYFENISIKDTVINGSGRAVELIGFTGEQKPKEQSTDKKKHYVHNVVLENVVLGNETEETKEIYLEACHTILFKNVKMHNGKAPEYRLEPNSVSDIAIED